MATQQQVFSQCEPLGPTAVLGDVLRWFREALSQVLERRRLYSELTRLDHRELADLRLQPHDFDFLLRGQPVPSHLSR